MDFVVHATYSMDMWYKLDQNASYSETIQMAENLQVKPRFLLR